MEHQVELEALVRMLQSDYDDVQLIRVSQRLFRTRKRTAYPQPGKPWKENWAIPRERWDEYTRIMRDLDIAAGVIWDDAPEGPILVGMRSSGIADNSQTTGLAYSQAAFVDQEWKAASIQFRELGGNWAVFGHYTW